MINILYWAKHVLITKTFCPIEVKNQKYIVFI